MVVLRLALFELMVDVMKLEISSVGDADGELRFLFCCSAAFFHGPEFAIRTTDTSGVTLKARVVILDPKIRLILIVEHLNTMIRLLAIPTCDPFFNKLD